MKIVLRHSEILSGQPKNYSEYVVLSIRDRVVPTQIGDVLSLPRDRTEHRHIMVNEQ
jgi:hypothetical protein